RSAPAVTGKFAEAVDPVTYAAPVPSVAMALPTSSPAPPRSVMYSTACSNISNLATNASRLPPGVGDGCRAPIVGKFVENVPPVTYTNGPKKAPGGAGTLGGSTLTAIPSPTSRMTSAAWDDFVSDRPAPGPPEGEHQG